MMGSLIGKSRDDHTWQFVNVSDPAQRKSRALQKVVRANAMRHYRKEQRQNVADQRRCSTRVTSAGVADTCLVVTQDNTSNPSCCSQPTAHLSKVESSSLTLLSRPAPGSEKAFEKSDRSSAGEAEYIDKAQQYQLISRVRKSPGLGSSDPFDTLPIRNRSGSTNHILHHCKLPKR